jgi:tRNA-binding protein
MQSISMEDFERVDMRVARVLEAEEFPEARKPSYKLTLDLGPLGQRRSSAAIRGYYRKEELLGRLLVCVVNFPPRRIAGFESEVLCLGAVEADGRVRMLRPDPEATPGTRVA